MEDKKITTIADLAEYFGIGKIKGMGQQVQEGYMDMICEVIQNKYSHIRKVVFGYDDVVFFDNLGVLTFPFFVYELEDILFKRKKEDFEKETWMENKKITCIADLAKYFGVPIIKGIGPMVEKEYIEIIREHILAKYNHFFDVSFTHNEICFFGKENYINRVSYPMSEKELQATLDGYIIEKNDHVITVDEKRDPDFDLKREMFFVVNKLRENSFHLWSRAIKEEDGKLRDELIIRSERERKDAMVLFCSIIGVEYPGE